MKVQGIVAFQLLVDIVSSLTASKYHRAVNHGICMAPASVRSRVDIVCRIQSQPQDNCHLNTVKWYHRTNDGNRAVQTGNKYDIWHGDWAMPAGVVVSWLRIKSLRAADTGTYKCEVKCQNKTKSQKSEVCLQSDEGNNSWTCANTPSEKCMERFGDGACDKECDNSSDLFDGFDCMPRLGSCSLTDTAECQVQYANGRCDRRCNVPQCGYDGGECFPRTSEKRFHGTIVVRTKRLVLDKMTRRDVIWGLARLLRTPVVEVRHYNYKYTLVPKTTKRYQTRKVNIHNATDDFFWETAGDKYEKSYILHLKLLCKDKRCLHNAELAARFIIAAMPKYHTLKQHLSAVGVERKIRKCVLDNKPLMELDDVLTELPGVKSSKQRSIRDRIRAQSSSKSMSTILGIDMAIFIGASLGAAALMILIVGIICIKWRTNPWEREQEQFPRLNNPRHVSKKTDGDKKQWHVTVNESTDITSC